MAAPMQGIGIDIFVADVQKSVLSGCFGATMLVPRRVEGVEFCTLTACLAFLVQNSLTFACWLFLYPFHTSV